MCQDLEISSAAAIVAHFGSPKTKLLLHQKFLRRSHVLYRCQATVRQKSIKQEIENEYKPHIAAWQGGGKTVFFGGGGCCEDNTVSWDSIVTIWKQENLGLQLVTTTVIIISQFLKHKNSTTTFV